MKEIIQNNLVLIYGVGSDKSFAYDAGRVLRYAFFSFGNGSAIAGMDWTITQSLNNAACK